MLTVYLYATVCYMILSPLPSHNDKNHLPLAELFPPIQPLTTRKTTIPLFPPWFLSHFSLRSYPICNFSKSLPALKCGLHSVRYNLNFISQCPLLIKLYFWVFWKMNMGTVNKIITNHDYNNALNTRHEMWIWEVKQCHHKNGAAWKLNKWFLYRIPVRTGRKMKSKQNKR